MVFLNEAIELNMVMEKDVLPIEALPRMSKLIAYFNKALAETIEFYKRKDIDFKEFQKESTKYEADFELFDRSFKTWLKMSNISKIEQDLLKELKLIMSEAQDLVAYIRH